MLKRRRLAIKEFLIGFLAIFLPVWLFYDRRFLIIFHPIREILWYDFTHGAAIMVVLALAPLFVFFPYSIVMIVIIMKDFIKKHKKEVRKNKHK